MIYCKRGKTENESVLESTTPYNQTQRINDKRQANDNQPVFFVYEDEWAMTKEFASIVKKDPEWAKRMMKTE